MTSPVQSLPSGRDARPPLILQPGSPLGRLAAKEPWSPRDRDSIPLETNHSRNMDYDDDVAPSSLLREGLRRREPSSESAIDDIDLADYTNIVQRNQQQQHNTDHRATSNFYGAQTTDRVPTVPAEYPPTPIFSRPFSIDRYPSYYPQSPSIAYHQESYSRQFPVDPRSLPNFLAPLSPPAANRFIPTPDSLATPRTPNTESDMDISHFPAYTHAWYDKKPNTSHSNGWHSGNNSRQSDGSGLPWNIDRDNASSGSAIDPITKRERVRMLEHEFGKDAVEATQKSRPVIGSVDANGNLITAGPRKRVLARWAQALLALLGGISAIYGALFIKPKSGPAPPASTAPAFVLYAAFILSFCLSVYLFVFRPCCGKRNKPDALDPTGNGMFVLPVQGFTGTGQQQKKKKGKKNQGNQSDVHINLIIDPRMLQQQGERDRLDADDDMLTSSHATTSQSGGGGNRRRTVFEGLALENQWKRARSFLRKLFAFDMLCLVVWGAVFVYVLFGKKCPPGEFDGWCTSYNIAIACSCFLCLAFGCSIFFDIVDLHASRISPRTRT